ncbi:MAG: hypothetical protein ACC618_03250 [Patescibacteria group bacterium]
MVVDMRKENIAKEESASNQASTLPEDVKKILRQGQVEAQKTTDWFEKQKPLCPTHRLPGTFDRYEGAYTRVHGIFKCPKGDKFNYASRAQPQQQ